MRPSTALVVMLPLIVLVTLFVLVGTRGAGAGRSHDGMWWDEQIASFVRRRVAMTYVDDLDRERAAQAFYKAMDAYVHELDEYCDFIPPEEHRKWQEDTAGEYAGLGIKITEADLGLLVVGVFPGGPADLAGMKPGDTIVAAGDTPLKGLDFKEIEASRLLKGEPGSIARITVIPGPVPEEGEPTAAPKVVSVKRAKVRPPTVFVRRVGPESEFGVIRLTEFAEATADDFNKALETMTSEGVKGLILDLRRNGGGVLPTAVAVVNRFVERGTIVRMEGRAPNATRVYEATAEDTLPDTLPLIVIVDGTSASASEVVAGALQDHRRALLVGERTYGKFLVQQIVDIPGEDAALQLTTSRYYLPSGRSYQRPRKNGRGHVEPRNGASPSQGGGLLPDVVLGLDEEQTEKLEKQFINEEGVPWQEEPQHDDVPLDWVDPQLERAIALLQGQMVLRKIRGTR